MLTGCTAGGNWAEPPDDIEVTYGDEDADTILDLHEGFVDEHNAEEGETHRDSDGDATPDYQDTDSDDDGIADEIEAGDDDVWTLPWDSDVDGTPDYLDLDSDGNCISDTDDGVTDADGDGLGNFSDLDDDGDGIKDIYEIGDSCDLVDSDGDGTPDYLDIDSDGDGIGDAFEAGTSPWEDEPADTDGDGVPDYLDDDSDGDGISDSDEAGVQNELEEPRDTDGDGLYDFIDRDSDGDGLFDDDELGMGTDPYDDDSDGDGYSDGAEISAGTDPMDSDDVIEGLYVTVEERDTVEQVFEFELNIQMGDVAFLLDTTCSMSGTVSGMSSEFSSIVSDLTTTLPDAEYGVATFDDFAYGSYGSSSYSDKPFELRQQVTDNVGQVQSVLSSIPLHGGSDGPESGMEALYQGLTGAGYDQNCSGTYDSTTDVRPFLASASDPFNGGGGQFYSSSWTGGGNIGGFGFRDYALPVLVYATDNYLRDPENGYGVPGGCPGEAGYSDVVAAALANNAFLIGIAANYSTPIPQMNNLSDATGSYADTDGDGLADDRLVFQWTGSSAALRNTIVNAIGDLVGSIQFSEISLEIDGDTHGFVTNIDPETYTLSGSASGEVVDFVLEFRGVVAATEEDQIFTLNLNVIGDGTILLDTLTIYVLVPGSSY